MFYIPEGCAHGYQTLADDTEVFYQMSEYYHPASARGLRFDDPALGIEWPLSVSVISPRDKENPLFERES
jgi:dTDP-4-dehydrorhamnose 3,5-epimerase